MINQLTDNLRKKMDETMQSLKRDMDSISTGRANPSLLDTIRVEIYGSMMPISQLANISIPESNILSIQVWDKESVKSVEKAIINSNLGFKVFFYDKYTNFKMNEFATVLIIGWIIIGISFFNIKDN